MGDVIPYYENGEFQLFYLKNWNPYFGSDRKKGWHLLTTKDCVHYNPEIATGIVGGTGSVIKADGVYHLYYCIFESNPQRQYVCHATSTDLKSWTKYPEETFGPDESIYLLTDWRDPHVIGTKKKNAGGCFFVHRVRAIQSDVAVSDFANLLIFIIGHAALHFIHRSQVCLLMSAQIFFI